MIIGEPTSHRHNKPWSSLEKCINNINGHGKENIEAILINVNLKSLADESQSNNHTENGMDIENENNKNEYYSFRTIA